MYLLIIYFFVYFHCPCFCFKSLGRLCYEHRGIPALLCCVLTESSVTAAAKQTQRAHLSLLGVLLLRPPHQQNFPQLLQDCTSHTSPSTPFPPTCPTDSVTHLVPCAAVSKGTSGRCLTSHRKGFSPECCREWTLRDMLRLKDFPQVSHVNGMSLVCAATRQ